jgi:hypothetical protein
MTEQERARTDTVRKIAPVLDEIKGKHGMGVFTSIGIADNEMIYAHRRRISKVNDTKNMNELLAVGAKIAPNVFLMERDSIGALISGKNYNGVLNQRVHERVAEEHKEAIGTKLGIDPHAVDHTHVEQLLQQNDSSIGSIVRKAKKGKQTDNDSIDLSTAGSWGTNLAIAPLVDKIVESNQRRLERSFSRPFSALDMVLTLDEQLKGNPDMSSFQLPGKDGNSLPLEGFLMEMIVQHQRDMSDFSQKHTEIREALKDDVIAAVKPLAEALRKGDIGALSLVRLVGEGHLIKNGGRSIASVQEVENWIEKQAGKPTTQAHVDPKEYLKNSSFSLEDLKKALGTLQGEEKYHLAVMVPDEVLVAAGMAEEEVKSLRDATNKHREQLIGEALAGVNAKSDDQLKKEGLGKNEITQIRDAYTAFKDSGDKAIHELKSNSTHATGLEQVLANWAVPNVIGDKAHFGKVITAGRSEAKQIVETAATNPVADDSSTKKAAESIHHTKAKDMVQVDKSEEDFADKDADNSEEKAEKTSFADREDKREESRSQAGEAKRA